MSGVVIGKLRKVKKMDYRSIYDQTIQFYRNRYGITFQPPSYETWLQQQGIQLQYLPLEAHSFTVAGIFSCTTGCRKATV